MDMDYKYLSIGQMARINNISVPTLRFYDSIGILQPCYTDPQTAITMCARMHGWT